MEKVNKFDIEIIKIIQREKVFFCTKCDSSKKFQFIKSDDFAKSGKYLGVGCEALVLECKSCGFRWFKTYPRDIVRKMSTLKHYENGKKH